MKRTLALMTTAAITLSPTAFANEYNRISFNSEVKSQIANDEIRASLSKTAQAATAAAIAKELNSSINAMLAISKRYPEVVVSTGQQTTYPRYNNAGKIIGFTGSVSLNLKSGDFAKTSQLIADLQSVMVVDDISFGVSDTLKEQEEKRLQLEAIKRFGKEAEDISRAFGSTGYKIVNVSLNGDGYNRPAMPMMAAMKAAESSVPQNFEAGNTTLSYTANGTIELVK